MAREFRTSLHFWVELTHLSHETCHTVRSEEKQLYSLANISKLKLAGKDINTYYYIDTDEIPQFFLLLKYHDISSSRTLKILFYLSHGRILVSPWLLTLILTF